MSCVIAQPCQKRPTGRRRAVRCRRRDGETGQTRPTCFRVARFARRRAVRACLALCFPLAGGAAGAARPPRPRGSVAADGGRLPPPGWRNWSDAPDLKSGGPQGRAGSSPAPGIPSRLLERIAGGETRPTRSPPTPAAVGARQARAGPRPERTLAHATIESAAQPPPDPPRLQRADARHAARGARPDDRRDRAADDRRRPRRARPPLLGRHRLHPRLDDLDAALRQARRPLRAQAAVPVRDRRLPRRLRALRDLAEHGRADRLPRAAGARRRRADGRRARDHRRPRPRRGSAAATRATWAASSRSRRSSAR